MIAAIAVGVVMMLVVAVLVGLRIGQSVLTGTPSNAASTAAASSPVAAPASTPTVESVTTQSPEPDPVITRAAPTTPRPTFGPSIPAVPATQTPLPEVSFAETQPLPPAPPAEVAPEPTMTCPSGKVASGLTDVAVRNKQHWMDDIYTMDLVGHGSVHNGTTVAVELWLYLPYIQGLDESGNVTMNGFSGDFDYNPPKGTPRPGSISLAPGQTAKYTFTLEGVTSNDMSETVGWYSDPKDPVSRYSDLDLQIACPDVVVSAPPNGPSIMNTFRSS